MKYLYTAGMVAGTVICLGMSTRTRIAFGGEWLAGLAIIGLGLWKWQHEEI